MTFKVGKISFEVEGQSPNRSFYICDEKGKKFVSKDVDSLERFNLNNGSNVIFEEDDNVFIKNGEDPIALVINSCEKSGKITSIDHRNGRIFIKASSGETYQTTYIGNRNLSPLVLNDLVNFNLKPDSKEEISLINLTHASEIEAPGIIVEKTQDCLHVKLIRGSNRKIILLPPHPETKVGDEIRCKIFPPNANRPITLQVISNENTDSPFLKLASKKLQLSEETLKKYLKLTNVAQDGNVTEADLYNFLNIALRGDFKLGDPDQLQSYPECTCAKCQTSFLVEVQDAHRDAWLMEKEFSAIGCNVCHSSKNQFNNIYVSNEGTVFPIKIVDRDQNCLPLLTKEKISHYHNSSDDLDELTIEESDYEGEDPDAAEEAVHSIATVEKIRPNLESVLELRGNYKSDTQLRLKSALLKKFKLECRWINAQVLDVIDTLDGFIDIKLRSISELKIQEQPGAVVVINETSHEILGVNFFQKHTILTIKAIAGGIQIGQQVNIIPPAFSKGLVESWDAHIESLPLLINKIESRKKRTHSNLNLEEKILLEYEKELNEMQRESVHLINNETGIIWGPPGTGKTHTLKKLVHLLLSRGKKVLVLAYNNKTVDDVLSKILDESKKTIGNEKLNCARPGKRIDLAKYGPLSSLLDLEEEITDLRIIESKLISVGSKSEKYKIARDVDNLMAKVNEKQKDRVLGANLVAMTCVGATYQLANLLANKFDYVIFDEASQIPISYSLLLSMLAPSTIFAGDPNQLEPVVGVKHHDSTPELDFWFGQSVFDVSEASLKDVNVTKMLNIQHRMNPQISDVVSKLFYENKLQSSKSPDFVRSTEESLSVAFRDQKINPGMTIVETSDIASRNGTRYSSVDDVIQIIHKFQEERVKLEDICVLTAYNNQVSAYKEELKKNGFQGVHISTIHKAQGQEYKYVIFDTMVIPNYFTSTTKNRIKCMRLMCVAMSRAQNALIVITHKSDRGVNEFINLMYAGSKIVNVQAPVKYFGYFSSGTPVPYERRAPRPIEIVEVTSLEHITHLSEIREILSNRKDNKRIILGEVNLSGLEAYNLNLSHIDFSKTTGLTSDMLNQCQSFQYATLPKMDLGALILEGKGRHRAKGVNFSLTNGLVPSQIASQFFEDITFPVMELTEADLHMERSFDGCVVDLLLNFDMRLVKERKKLRRLKAA